MEKMFPNGMLRFTDMIDYSQLEFMYNWEQKRLPLHFSLRNALDLHTETPRITFSQNYHFIDFPCYGISLRWILGNCGHPHY